ncbi:MAG: redoxin family protein [Flavobacteriales bacterium]
MKSTQHFFHAALAVFFMMSFVASAQAQAGVSGVSDELAIGASLPLSDHVMMNTDGSKFTLNGHMGDQGLLVIFSCNTCPFVVGNGEKSEGWEGRYNALNDAANAAGINMVLVNSNEAKREGDDSFRAMQKHAEIAGYTMPYVVDAGHQVADAFGARKTPHVYLFDAEGRLMYRGAIDDNVRAAKQVTANYLIDAIEAVGNGQKAELAKTPALGCSIKRLGS